MMIESKEFGAMLKIARQESGISVERMSELCGVHRNTICNWEKDARSMPYLSVINYCYILLTKGNASATQGPIKDILKRACLSEVLPLSDN